MNDGLSLKTLLISSASAVIAAVVVPLFWEKGTLVATALTPLIVALATELLSRPVDRIGSAGVWRQTVSGTAIREPVVTSPDAEPATEDELVIPAAPADEARRPRRHLKLALATGMLAFVVAAAVVTASELALFGGSVSKGDDRTTLFGGRSEEAAPTPEATPGPGETATPEASPSPEASPTPTVTVTVTATPTPGATVSPTATPAATATPAQTPGAPVPTVTAPGG